MDSSDQNSTSKDHSAALDPLLALWKEAQLNSDRPEFRRRLEIMIRSKLGKSRQEICRELGCSPETARYWIAMSEMGKVDVWSSCPVGRPQKITADYLQRLQEVIGQNPQNFGYTFKKWTAKRLQKHLFKEIGIKISDRHINRLLKEMGVSSPYRVNSKKTSSEPSKSKALTISIQDLLPASVAEKKTENFLLDQAFEQHQDYQ